MAGHLTVLDSIESTGSENVGSGKRRRPALPLMLILAEARQTQGTTQRSAALDSVIDIDGGQRALAKVLGLGTAGAPTAGAGHR